MLDLVTWVPHASVAFPGPPMHLSLFRGRSCCLRFSCFGRCSMSGCRYRRRHVAKLRGCVLIGCIPVPGVFFGGRTEPPRDCAAPPHVVGGRHHTQNLPGHRQPASRISNQLPSILSLLGDLLPCASEACSASLSVGRRYRARTEPKGSAR